MISHDKLHPMKLLFTILIFSFVSLKSYSQTDNLQPQTGFFSGFTHQDSYYPIVKKILFDSLPNNADLRVVVLPSFSPEYLISIDSKGSKTYLTYRIAKQQIWNFPKPKNDQIKFNQFQIQLDSSIAKKIHELFFLAISNAKYSTRDAGVDGTSYIFITFKNGFGLIGGQTWSPRTDKLSGLITITEWLVDCSKTGEFINKDKMLTLIKDLTLKFQKS
jgi:hypothetical protein